MPTTRRQLRRDCLRSLGDLRILTATANSASNITFIDSINLVAEPGQFTGREVLITGGTAANIGQQRYVVGSSGDNRSLQLADPLPANAQIGDVAELINTRGIGFRIQEIHDAINQSIRAVAGDSYVEPTTVDETSYSYGTPISLPPEFVTVEDVQWQDTYDSALWHSIPRSRRPNGKGWWVEQATRTLQITGRLVPINVYLIDAETPTPYTVRVWGLAAPTELYDDNDETNINHAWLIANTCAILLKQRYYRMPTPETERLMYDSLQEARALYPRVTSRVGPFSSAL